MFAMLDWFWRFPLFVYYLGSFSLFPESMLDWFLVFYATYKFYDFCVVSSSLNLTRFAIAAFESRDLPSGVTI